MDTKAKDITDLSENEKSVMLARAMGMTRVIQPGRLVEWWHDGNRLGVGSLYDPENMSLAWRVLNWAYKKRGMPNVSTNFRWDWCLLPFVDASLSPTAAQRLWLDRILKLCIEAGLVRVKR